MTVDDPTIEPDATVTLARLVYDEMNIEPRQMHLAIEMAKEDLRRIRHVLVERGLRRPDPPESPDV